MKKEETEEQIIARIIAQEDKQLEVDAIKQATESNLSDIDKVQKVMHDYLVEKNIENYPIDIEKNRKEKKEYTQTIQEELKRQQDQQRAIKYRLEKKTKQAVNAYIQQEIYKERITSINDSLEEEKEPKGKEKVPKGFLQRIIEKISKKGNGKPQEINKDVLTRMPPTHQEFTEKLDYQAKEVKQEDIKNKKEEDREEYR